MPDILFKKDNQILGVYKTMAEAARGIKDNYDIKGFSYKTLKSIKPIIEDERKQYKREKNNYKIEWTRHSTTDNRFIKICL